MARFVQLVNTRELDLSAAGTQAFLRQLGEGQHQVGDGWSLCIEQIQIEMKRHAGRERASVQVGRAKHEWPGPVRQAARAARNGRRFEHAGVCTGLAEFTLLCLATLRDARNTTEDRPERSAQDVARFRGWEMNGLARNEVKPQRL